MRDKMSLPTKNSDSTTRRTTQLRKVFDEYGANAGKKFDELLDKMEADDRLVRKPTNNRENLNPETKEVDIPQQHDSLQKKMRLSQLNEQSAAIVKEEEQTVHLKLDTKHKETSVAELLPSSDATEKLPEFSNRLKNLAQIAFTAVVVERTRVNCRYEEMRGIMQQRMTLIESPQYEYSLADVQQFNQKLLTKMKDLEPEFDWNMKYKPQVVIEMLQSEALYEYHTIIPFVRYLDQLDLLKCIVNNSDSVAAEHILRFRKLQLTRLSLYSKSSGNAYLSCDSVGDRTAAIYSGRFFQCEVEKNKVDAVHVLKLVNTILKVYDTTQARMSLGYGLSSSWMSYQLLESTFGTPPTDPNGKIKVKEIRVDSSEMIGLLRWICPTELHIKCDPGLLVDEPSLICGVDVIDCHGKNADRLIENCKTRVIRLGGADSWSEESILRVLTAHRLSADNGCSREIRYYRWIEDSDEDDTNIAKTFKELFDSWVHAFEAEHGKIGREVTLCVYGPCYGKFELH